VRAARLHDGVRILRLLLRAWGQGDQRTAGCGLKLGSPNGPEVWTRRDGHARRCDRARCGSSKLCAVCHDVLGLVRAALISVAVWRWYEQSEDHFAVFLSIAAGHRSSDRLAGPITPADTHRATDPRHAVVTTPEPGIYRAPVAQTAPDSL
jgi:hypothetical protein